MEHNWKTSDLTDYVSRGARCVSAGMSKPQLTEKTAVKWVWCWQVQVWCRVCQPIMYLCGTLHRNNIWCTINNFDVIRHFSMHCDSCNEVQIMSHVIYVLAIKEKYQYLPMYSLVWILSFTCFAPPLLSAWLFLSESLRLSIYCAVKFEDTWVQEVQPL